MKMVASSAIRKFREMKFLAGLKPVLATAPARARDDGVVLFSMIGTRVVLPYLVAAKSLHARLGMGRFAILDDGTLTGADRAALRHHLDDPVILDIAGVANGVCPKGGCWERLLALLDLRHDAYVIQVDSDTVTLGPLPEVREAIAQGRNFTLKGEAEARWMEIDTFPAKAPEFDAHAQTTHVQNAAEALLPHVDYGLGRKAGYIRGCAGFAGFAPGGLQRDFAEHVSRALEAALGRESWSRWGSEQVMSNVIVANEGEPLALPYERYLNYWNEPVPAGAAFVHFIGTYRYHNGAYRDAARRAITSLGG